MRPTWANQPARRAHKRKRAIRVGTCLTLMKSLPSRDGRFKSLFILLYGNPRSPHPSRSGCQSRAPACEQAKRDKPGQANPALGIPPFLHGISAGSACRVDPGGHRRRAKTFTSGAPVGGRTVCGGTRPLMGRLRRRGDRKQRQPTPEAKTGTSGPSGQPAYLRNARYASRWLAAAGRLAVVHQATDAMLLLDQIRAERSRLEKWRAP